MVQELAKLRALQLGYHINGASPVLLAFKLFGVKPLCALNVSELAPTVKPGVTTTKTSNDVVINASESTKRDDSRLFAFDSDDDNDEPVSRPQSQSKQVSSTGSTTKRNSSIDPKTGTH